MKTYDELVAAFIENRKIYCSESTVHYYEDNLMRFSKFIEKHNITIFDSDCYYQYIKYLNNTNVRKTTINTYARAIKQFFEFIYEHYNIYVNLNIKLPHQESKNKILITNIEAALIDNYLLSTLNPEKNFITFHLLLDLGLRRNDVVQLKVKNVNFNKNIVSVENSK